MHRVAALALGLAACSGGSGGYEFTQENNYTFTGELDLQTVQVVSETDLTIDWSGVEVDLRGRDVAGPPDQAALLKCAGSKAEILAQLDANTLAQADCLEQFLFDNAGGVNAALATEFSIGGNPLVATGKASILTDTDPAESNWLASILNTSVVGDDPLMTVFFDVRDTNTDTTVALTDDSSTFTYTVDLSTAPRLTGSGTTLDWSTVTTDVFGNAFNDLRGSQVLVARFDGDVAGIESDFLRIEDNAVELYRMQAFGITEVDLALAMNADGDTFGGFTSEGVWLVGITCPDCLNPAPLLMAVVDAG